MAPVRAGWVEDVVRLKPALLSSRDRGRDWVLHEFCVDESLEDRGLINWERTKSSSAAGRNFRFQITSLQTRKELVNRRGRNALTRLPPRDEAVALICFGLSSFIFRTSLGDFGAAVHTF